MRKNTKRYYPNLVHNEFVVAQPNRHWYADYSEINLVKKNKVYILLLIDGCFNEIIQWSVASKKPISSTDTVRRFETAIRQRNIPICKEGELPLLIIHTDRGTQFSGEIYFQFIQRFRNRFQASMSAMNTPTENAVAERFMRTFKNLKISDKEMNIKNKNVKEVLREKFKEEKIDTVFIKEVMAKFVLSYNRDKITKKANRGAKKNQQIFEEGKEFLKKPKFQQAYSEHAMLNDSRRKEIEIYKKELQEVWTDVTEALPENVSFLQAKPILIAKLRLIDEKVDQQFTLSLNTDQNVTSLVEGQKLTMNGLGQLAIAIQTLRDEVKQLKEKVPKKEKAEKIQLRDPIYRDHYDFFMIGAGESVKKKIKTVRTAQLRIIYTILYSCGLRVNEIKELEKNDIILAIQTSEFNIIHSKTNQCKKHVLPEVGKKILQSLIPEIELIFDEYGFKFLGNSKTFSDKTFSNLNFIRFINEDMSAICKKYNLLENFKSHSFRVGFISKLLRTLPLQKVSQIIGHSDTHSTMAYSRYAIDKEEIQKVLKEAFEK